MSSSGNNNITIRGFEVDGKHDKNTDVARGKNYYNVIYFIHCNDVKVYDMYIHDEHGDGLRIKYGENVQFYNNTVYKLGHDGMFAIECTNVEAWNNTITCRTNTGLRIWTRTRILTGSGGIVASGFHDILIENNVFDGVYQPCCRCPHVFCRHFDRLLPKGTGYTTTVSNNIITNTLQ
ncbi:hypothetical protein MSWHS_1761 [Methanosarcina sp. WWM596]|nr:hypothetical protein MSWHS_1761 [Methanosarcina sp. WWM596]AKB21820.1 hypothetical protein MSWH1_1549 [Methanosarcina sp. WH1]